jgi:malate-CoA ligase subunit beta
MDIHEYQAKEILARFGVPVPRGGLPTAPNRPATGPVNSAAMPGW